MAEEKGKDIFAPINEHPGVPTKDIADTLDMNSGFEDGNQMPTIIKVMGVGGGGNNAINHMYRQNIEGVSFVVLNTDRQQLNGSPVPNRVLLGPNTTKGLGAGNKPEVAKEAAEESAQEIAQLFDDETKMVFITAGMGGGTGTGAAPVVARIAHDKGVLTIGIVTIPFLFEGPKKIMKALQGADEMGKYVDALLIINNQRLAEIYPDLDFNNAFGKADDTLSTAARSISELITSEGRINLDFKDVDTTLRNGGVAIISTGYGEGDHRVTKAIEDALRSPLLKNRDVYGSRRILMNVYFNPESPIPFRMDELNELQEFMTNFDQEVDVIWGAAYDSSLDERIKITVLAAGFNMSYEDETPAQPQRPFIKRPTVAPPAPVTQDRVDDEYGKGALSKMTNAKYVILTPEQMDDDEVIAQLEKSPAYKRKPEERKQIVESQSNAAPERMSEPVRGPRRGDADGVIKFGDSDD